MNIRTIVNEPRRGCGYRKPGGLYLIAGRPSTPCGKLPLPLEVCPTCGQGIKPARGWTWVNGRELFKNQPCRYEEDGDDDISVHHFTGCFLEEPPEKIGLLWIGEAHYKTPADFLNEGIAQGISRRISAIPRDFKLCETWILFAHRKAIECVTCHTVGKPHESIGEATTVFDDVPLDPCPDCKGQGYIPGIFSCFLPTAIEYVVKEDDPEEKLQRMEERGISLIKLVRTDDGNGNGVLDLEENAAI